MLTFLRKNDSPEEWTYFADGRLECMDASKPNFHWDGENFTSYSQHADGGAYDIC